MAGIYTSMEQLIGKTPLFALTCADFKARLLLKLECFNPGGSVKDRAALSMLMDAEEKGLLVPGGTVIEPTSGNTGIGLAAVAAARGYRAVIVMPDTMSMERRLLMSAYGAEVVLTPGKLGMSGAVEKAKQLAKDIPDSYVPMQFENAANPAAHYKTTAPEIWEDTAGQVDIFVAGIGTGGSITGVGRFLKEKNPQIQIVGVEPADSPLLSGGVSGSHGIQGIGANFIPEALDKSVLTAVKTVTTENAYAASRYLARKAGLLCGISSGAALHIAMELSRQEENLGKTVVALLPDTGERYLSTDLWK